MTDKNSNANEEAEQITIRKVGAITYRPWPASAVAGIFALAAISLFKLAAGFNPEDLILPSILTSFFIAICVFVPYWVHERRYDQVYSEEYDKLIRDKPVPKT